MPVEYQRDALDYVPGLDDYGIFINAASQAEVVEKGKLFFQESFEGRILAVCAEKGNPAEFI